MMLIGKDIEADLELHGPIQLRIGHHIIGQQLLQLEQQLIAAVLFQMELLH